MRCPRNQVGATLVEALIAIALAGILLPTLAEAILTSKGSQPSAERRQEASSLAREALEVTRVAREAGWANVSANGVYHPAQQSNTWVLAAGTEDIDGLSRQITIADAQRDSSGQLVTSGGTTDPSTKHITALVSWTTPYAGSVSNDMYLARWQGGGAWTQTTEADFTAGTLTGTTVVASGDGAVQLSSASPGTFESVTFDAGNTVSLNNLSFTADQPAGATITLQIATSDTASPASWNYVGPDGTSGTYFTAAAAIPLSAANARYARFKAYLSTSTTTPTLDDVTISYTQ